ncbi:hypothetical protein [Pandoraea oxalativorans]|uniref:Uncharacterized protein n=1 Tax=Pandoraea oxalativorans TaxID=573737 RepID=A0A192B1G7_9BURK|nr:hypothetical protein [Pandoraea oxalativorans]ANJ87164.1 hypothetical protein MB84_27030 [Pandoraea oxalativorans]
MREWLEWRAPSLHLGVSRSAVSLVLHERKTRTWRVLGTTSLSQQTGDAFVPTLHDAVQALLLTHAPHRATLDIVIDDRLARLWMTTPPNGATRLSDIEGAATMRFAHLFGEMPEHWQIAGDWQVTHPFCTAALPRALVDTLTVTARACHIPVVGIAPQFVRAWNRWQRQCRIPGWFAAMHDGLLRLGITLGTPMRLHAMYDVPMPPDPDVYWLEQTLSRAAMLTGAAAPTTLHLCGTVPNEGRVTLAALNLHALAASVDLAVYDWQPSELLATGGALV